VHSNAAFAEVHRASSVRWRTGL